MADNQVQAENEKYKVWFFAGAETRDELFNPFTGSFIRLMNEILGEDFNFIKGVNLRYNIQNVFWALNNAQKPIADPGKNRVTKISFDQIMANDLSKDTQLIIVSSSAGSVMAAQAACFIAESWACYPCSGKPFHLILGASMISKESELFRKLLEYQEKERIGKIIHDEIQDSGDNAAGVGGRTRAEAYRHALGIAFPFVTRKYSGPSFLNTHPVKGHIHRRRSKTVQKALDYIDIILIKHKLAGLRNMEKAISIIEESRYMKS